MIEAIDTSLTARGPHGPQSVLAVGSAPAPAATWIPCSDVLARFRAGEREILGLVYQKHVRLIEARLRCGAFTSRSGIRLSAGVLGMDVADLVQEVFLHAFRPRARLAYDGTRPYANYLWMIARNLLIDLLRASRRRVTVCPIAFADSGATGESTAGPPADREIAFSVGRYVASLAPALRQLHELRYVHELSQDEAATALGTTRQRLRTLEKRLHDGLRAELGDERAQTGDRAADPLRTPAAGQVAAR